MALNAVQQPPVVIDLPPADPAQRRPQNQEIDARVYAYVVLGRVLQFGAVILGVVFAVCMVKVSPLYLLAEIIPMILWAAGIEIAQARVAHDGSVYIPAFADPPFIP